MLQKFDLNSKRLLSYIVQKFHPALYASEWYTGRFDCSSIYRLSLIGEPKWQQWDPKKLLQKRSNFFQINRRGSQNWPYHKVVSETAGLEHTHWEKVVIVKVPTWQQLDEFSTCRWKFRMKIIQTTCSPLCFCMRARTSSSGRAAMGVKWLEAF